MKENVVVAETVEEATALALAEMGLSEEEATIEILEEPGKKLFGGRKDAVVRVTPRKEGEEDSVEDNNAEDSSEDGPEDNGDSRSDEAKQIVEELLDAGENTGERSEGVLAAEDLTDEQIDAIADAGIEYLKKIIAYLSESEITIEEFEGDEGEIILDVSGENVGTLIGRHGRTIDALQVVVSAMTTKKMGVRYPLSVDVEGYKHRRRQKVIDIAQRAASRAERTGRPVALKSMSPQERRIVHMALRDVEGVTTTSEGSGLHRHVVIVPV